MHTSGKELINLLYNPAEKQAMMMNFMKIGESVNTDFIIVHGSPGTGKTTLSRKMHDYFKSPYFEFGWIPEFRSLTPSIEITQRQEEQLTFENLILVAKNYNRHGFKNLIITDLDDVRMRSFEDGAHFQTSIVY